MIWLALWLVGCTVLWDAPEGDPEAESVFPHPEGFVQGMLHGDAAVTHGVGTCMSCHQAAGEGMPSCSSCHPSYPHDPDWLGGEVHGQGLAHDSGAIASCQMCHEAPGRHAQVQASCSSCHASYPHPQGWVAPTAHGAYALDRGDPVAACGSCHGPDLGGGSSQVGCQTCHTSYPHAAGWEDPEFHGVAARANPADCTTCHDPGAGRGGPSCGSCHEPWPHPEGWSMAHMKVADSHGEATCMGCHQGGDGPAAMFAGCGGACHGGTP